jgi:hypothetical protein
VLFRVSFSKGEADFLTVGKLERVPVRVDKKSGISDRRIAIESTSMQPSLGFCLGASLIHFRAAFAGDAEVSPAVQAAYPRGLAVSIRTTINGLVPSVSHTTRMASWARRSITFIPAYFS